MRLLWNTQDLRDQILRGDEEITLPFFLLMRSRVRMRLDVCRNVTVYRCQQDDGAIIDGKNTGHWWHRTRCKGAADCDAPTAYAGSDLLSSIEALHLPAVEYVRRVVAVEFKEELPQVEWWTR